MPAIPDNLPNRAGSRRGDADHDGLGEDPAKPSPASLLDQSGPVSSLPSLATSATLVDAIWGMGSVAVAGYDGNNSAYATEYVVSMPQTLLAGGNNPLSLPAFTSEIIAGAGGVFGRINVANMAPVTQSSNIVGLGFKDVAAGTNAPDTGSKGPDPSINSVTNVVKPATGGCFAAGTLIPMADGTAKPIERIEEEDDVHGVDQNDPEGAYLRRQGCRDLPSRTAALDGGRAWRRRDSLHGQSPVLRSRPRLHSRPSNSSAVTSFALPTAAGVPWASLPPADLRNPFTTSASPACTPISSAPAHPKRWFTTKVGIHRVRRTAVSV